VLLLHLLSLLVLLGNISAGAAVSSFLCFDEAHVYNHLLGLQSIVVLVERAADLKLPFSCNVCNFARFFY
jgi:hypothetical protein